MTPPRWGALNHLWRAGLSQLSVLPVWGIRFDVFRHANPSIQESKWCDLSTTIETHVTDEGFDAAGMCVG